MKICYIADAISIHTQRWVKYFADKENVTDTRESPIRGIVKELKEYGVDIFGYDPLLNDIESEFGIKPYDARLLTKDRRLSTNRVDCVILAVAHEAFKDITLDKLKGIMKRGELAPEELDKVIRLKKFGTSWLKIEHETGISRRTAKRAYEKWKHSQSPELLREARKEVAAKAFLEHMESLVTLATSFVMNLDVPELPHMMETNAEQFCSQLFNQDLLYRLPSISTETMEAYTPVSRPPVVDMQSYRREQELLFECLKVHTREEVRWKAWDEWKKARDNYAKIVSKLRRETTEGVNNFVNQERQTNLLQSIKEGSGEHDPVKKMAEVMFRAIWKHIRQDKLDEEGPWFERVSQADGKTHVVYVKPRYEVVLAFPDKSRADKVTRICELVTSNLRKGDIVQQLYSEVCEMEKASEELHEMLNPVKLRPIILRTRCDLCPA